MLDGEGIQPLEVPSVSGSLHRQALTLREQNVPGPYKALMSRSSFNRLLDEVGGFLVVDEIRGGKIMYGEFEIEIWDA